MRARFGRAGRWLWALLLFPFGLVLQLILKLARWLLVVGRWLWGLLSPVVSPIGRFGGRLGLALRNLLTWFVWEPFFLLLLSPFLFFVRWSGDHLKRLLWWLWRFWGRVGLALRHLLTLFIWRPLRPILAPLGQAVWTFVRRRWQAGAPRRAYYRRYLRSRWLVFRARMRLAFKRPPPPETAEVAPRVPRPVLANTRLMRFATAFISVGIVLMLSFITMQENQPGQVSAGNGFSLPRIIVVTPALSTPTPEPTVEVKLTPWPTPDLLSQGGTLAFTWHRDGNSDIYVLPVGQTEPVPLTSHPAAEREPAWSPNGQEVAFASDRDGNWEIYVYNLAAGKLRRITNEPAFDGHPSWSPDGKWLVYESYRGNNLDVYIVKADLSEGPFRLTENNALDFAPTWSPSGRHIAFTSWRSGNKDVFIMSLNEVTDEAAVNVTASPDTDEGDPAFSPDGRYLAYSEDDDGVFFLYALPLTEEYTVAGTPINLGQRGRHPTWSPDSQSLIYVHDKEARSYLMAGSPEAWGVAPQAYEVEGRLESPSWIGVTLTPDLVANLPDIDRVNPNRRLYRELTATPEAEDPPVLLWELAVNAPSPYLSDRVDQSFLALRERVEQEAGWDFLGRLDNMFEAIDSKPLPGQTGRTWHKAGRAFDLYSQEALAFEPQVEVVREDIGLETYWRVYVRAARQDGSQGEPLRELPWDFRVRFGDEPQYYDQGGKWKDTIPAGYYVDFTALAADYGWTRVPADKNWRTYFPGIRFWHYEKREGLTWEQAMLQLYTSDELADVFEAP